jgi:hypothetical protein
MSRSASGREWFEIKEYAGILEEHSEQARDAKLIAFPHYRTSIRVLSGASGGPVLSRIASTGQPIDRGLNDDI